MGKFFSIHAALISIVLIIGVLSVGDVKPPSPARVISDWLAATKPLRVASESDILHLTTSERWRLSLPDDEEADGDFSTQRLRLVGVVLGEKDLALIETEGVVDRYEIGSSIGAGDLGAIQTIGSKRVVINVESQQKEFELFLYDEVSEDE